MFASPSKYQLSASAISLELGKLDDDLWADAAILTGDGVSIDIIRVLLSVKAVSSAATLRGRTAPRTAVSLAEKFF